MNNKESLKLLISQCTVLGPVSKKIVAAAENELQVSFPEEYKQFLYEFGALMGNGIEIYGLPAQDEANPPFWQNVVTVTQQLQSYNQIGAENKKFIPISSDGMDMNYFMDTTKSPELHIWAIGHDSKLLIASNLYEFMIKIRDLNC